MSSVDKDKLPFRERPDLTPYLIHLTRNSRDEDDFSAFDNLVKILMTGKVWGSSRKGFIKGRKKAACFMDVPFVALKYVLKKENAKRYEPYGVFVTKEFAYKQGARPVLYLSDAELSRLRIPLDEHWRVSRFETTEGNKWINWYHEREWRCPGDFDLPSNPGVLVRTTREVLRLQKLIDKDPDSFRSVPRTILPLHVVCQGLKYYH